MAYLTESGLAVPSVTEAEMREVDRIAIEETGPNLYQMMENAGRSLASRVQLAAGDAGGPVIVLAGTGGNGGGGICAARHLANHGLDVVVVVSDEERLTPVPQQQLRVYEETTGSRTSLSGLDDLDPSVVVDALVGYSLSGAPTGVVAEMIAWANGSGTDVVSLDVPSGVDSTDGSTPGAHINPRETLTLALPKTGLSSSEAGELWLADIGIPAGAYRRAGLEVPARLFASGPIVRLVPS